MMLKTKNSLFFGDLTITKNTRISIFSPISRLLLLLFFLLFSSSLFLTVNGTNSHMDKAQLPTKAKAKITTTKKIKTKSKGKKVKKNVIIKKDTLKDIDPASTNSPLYNN